MTSAEHINLLRDVCGDSVRLDVFYYILEHMNCETRTYYGSYESVSRGLGVSLSAVINAMKMMQRAGYFQMVKNGEWKVTDAVQVYPRDEIPEGLENEIPVEFKNYS